MTITLCGLAISNYYNKVKLALLEKGVPFEEERVATGSRDEAVLAASPLGKFPSCAPRAARCAKARPSSTTSRSAGRSRRCCRPTPMRAPRCAS